MRTKLMIAMAGIAALLLARNLYVILLELPDEAAQGAIYRIIFFHVPAAWTAFLCFFAAMIASILYLVKKDLRHDAFAASATEVGLAFGAANLISGMIWARIIWGIWWTWDPRLTTATIMELVYIAYLMLRQGIDDPERRARFGAVYAIVGFLSVPLTFFSIRIFRT
ncbi:MAG TPA: cytochrome c biogenesis protein CcsA, partial [Bryobacteraceae bacterium]|nr:cytochrome c biogenesis protein CcsA [Bryobacteraceae bacterium]